MTSRRRVANAPDKPVLVYDAECRFCVFWIQRWRQRTGEAVAYRPLQDPQISVTYPELVRERMEQAVHLVEPDGRVSEGAEAVFRSLAADPRRRWLADRYARSPLFARSTEWLYRFVARHRGFFSRLTGLVWRNEFRQTPQPRAERRGDDGANGDRVGPKP